MQKGGTPMRQTMPRTAADRRAALWIAVLAAALLALFLASFVLGRYDVPIGQVVRILLSRVIPLLWVSTASTLPLLPRNLTSAPRTTWA